MAKSTLKAYDSAWSYFTLFCAAYTISLCPINIDLVCAYILHCFESHKIHPLSIKASLAGIQFHLRCRDPNTPSLLIHPSIRLLFQGILKTSPDSKDKRLPLPLPLLHKLLHCLRLGVFGFHTDLLLETAFLTAFYGFLRCWEFTCNTLSLSPAQQSHYI